MACHGNPSSLVADIVKSGALQFSAAVFASFGSAALRLDRAAVARNRRAPAPFAALAFFNQKPHFAGTTHASPAYVKVHTVAAIMTDRSIAYRAWSAECLGWAQQTTDHSLRLAFLTLAQRWMDLAKESADPVVGQQQQQIQPKNSKAAASSTG